MVAELQSCARGWCRTVLPLAEQHGYTEPLAYSRLHLPVAPHDPQGLRHRAYAQGIVRPDAGFVAWLPPVWSCGWPEVGYRQDPGFNPEAGGTPRRFAAFPTGMTDLPVIYGAVESCLRLLVEAGLLDGADARPWLCGVHLVKLAPAADRAAVASPPCLHRDGEPFTWVILVERVNVGGGVNTIAPPDRVGSLPQDPPAWSSRASCWRSPATRSSWSTSG